MIVMYIFAFMCSFSRDEEGQAEYHAFADNIAFSNVRRMSADSFWDTLQDHVNEIDMLLGSSVKRPQRWSDLRRHLHQLLKQRYYKPGSTSCII